MAIIQQKYGVKSCTVLRRSTTGLRPPASSLCVGLSVAAYPELPSFSDGTRCP